jgi:hypothetical protein
MNTQRKVIEQERARRCTDEKPKVGWGTRCEFRTRTTR